MKPKFVKRGTEPLGRGYGVSEPPQGYLALAARIKEQEKKLAAQQRSQKEKQAIKGAAKTFVGEVAKLGGEFNKMGQQIAHAQRNPRDPIKVKPIYPQKKSTAKPRKKDYGIF